MPEVIITYENLYEILRREKYRSELQKLDDTFYKDVVKYLQEKKAILESQAKKDSIFASTEVQKTETQIKNVMKILKELYEKRENKILQFALFTSRSRNPLDTSTMLPEEYTFYSTVRGQLDEYREGILMRLLQHQLPSVEANEQKPLKIEEKTDNMLVRILKDIPEFVGPDLQVYGPYTKGDAQGLPEMVAKLLIQTEQAKHETP